MHLRVSRWRLTDPRAWPIATLVDDIERDGRGVVMTMGKGGVGKTTMAAAIAVELAARGHDVMLSTTDPAAHVAGAVGARSRACASRGSTLSRRPGATARKSSRRQRRSTHAAVTLLEEDLRSPCTEEIAVFRAFAQTVAEGEQGFVVLDTAPDRPHAAAAGRRRSLPPRGLAHARGAPDAVRRLLPRLRDPQFTKVLLVTLPEATPVHEAVQLQADLRRAGIEPFAWIVNQSFAGDDIRDPVLRDRGAREDRYLTEVATLGQPPAPGYPGIRMCRRP